MHISGRSCLYLNLLIMDIIWKISKQWKSGLLPEARISTVLRLLRQVEAEDFSSKIASFLDKSARDISKDNVFKPVLTSPDSDLPNFVYEANNSKNCIGLIIWMHTFSPAKDVDKRDYQF